MLNKMIRSANLSLLLAAFFLLFRSRQAGYLAGGLLLTSYGLLMYSHVASATCICEDQLPMGISSNLRKEIQGLAYQCGRLTDRHRELGGE